MSVHVTVQQLGRVVVVGPTVTFVDYFNILCSSWDLNQNVGFVFVKLLYVTER